MSHAAGAMSTRPRVVVFDVNETLSDLRPMADHFEAIGAPKTLFRLWFTSVLRDGLGLAATGTSERFSMIAEENLRVLLAAVPLNRDLDAAIAEVMGGFMTLAVHPDVPGGVRALKESGLRLVTLSNGAAAVAEALLGNAGLRNDFDHVLSVEDAGIWKPAPGAYHYAAQVCDEDPAAMVLVAVHPWDLDGATRAGMATAWINRDGGPYPRHLSAPTWTVTALGDLASMLGQASRP